jgi:hypothetical protein
MCFNFRKGSPGAAVKCNTWKQPLGEMQGKAAYIRPKAVGPFPGPYASGSYVHRAAFFLMCFNFNCNSGYETYEENFVSVLFSSCFSVFSSFSCSALCFMYVHKNIGACKVLIFILVYLMV